MKIGYARVSTDDQNLDFQHRALTKAGCKIVYDDQGISGASFERQGLTDALNALGEDDILIVWKLDRLGRSLGDLIHIIDNLGKAGAGFVSLSEAIDTTTAGGKLVFHMMGALSEFERSLIAERTKAGMSAAKKRRVKIGRPRKLTKTQIAHAREIAWMKAARKAFNAFPAGAGADRNGADHCGSRTQSRYCQTDEGIGIGCF